MLSRRRGAENTPLARKAVSAVGLLGFGVWAARSCDFGWVGLPWHLPRRAAPPSVRSSCGAVATDLVAPAVRDSPVLDEQPFPGAVPVEIRMPGMRLHVLEASVQWQEELIEKACNSADDSLEADPYGMAIWPSAQVLAQAAAAYAGKLRRPGRKARVLELGAGCGLASLAMAKLGVDVLATDFRKLPLELLEESARREGLSKRVKTEVFDICDMAVPLPEADLIIAADVMYDADTARAMAMRTAEARFHGCTVLIADVGRPNCQLFFDDLKMLRPQDSTMARFSCTGTAVQGRLQAGGIPQAPEIKRVTSTGVTHLLGVPALDKGRFSIVRSRGSEGTTTNIEKEIEVNVIELPGPGLASAALRPGFHSFALRPEGHDHVL